jgi:hypothetical protein
MLRQFLHSVAASLPPVSLRLEPLPAPPALVVSRPAWDDGVNYDVPAYLRPRRPRSKRPTVPPAG